jgi:hypothetical protein
MGGDGMKPFIACVLLMACETDEPYSEPLEIMTTEPGPILWSWEQEKCRLDFRDGCVAQFVRDDKKKECGPPYVVTCGLEVEE